MPEGAVCENCGCHEFKKKQILWTFGLIQALLMKEY